MEIKKISNYINIKEAIKSKTAIKYNIDNTPNTEELLNMQNLGFRFFDPLREHFDTPIFVSSFFRSKKLNKKIKGAKNSDHITGQAIDIDQDGKSDLSNNEIFDYIVENLNFYKIIGEFPDENGNYKWIHVSFMKDSELNKKKIVLEAYKDAQGKTNYRRL
jgi:hypothetical protein